MSRWSPWLLSTLLVAASLGAAPAQEGAVIFVEPPSQVVDPAGPSFTVRVMVDNVTSAQGLGGYTLVMTYGLGVVRATAVTDSGFVQSTGNAVVCPASAIDDEEGRLAHVCFTIPVLPAPGPQVTEPQALASVSFEPVGAGTTALDISETTIVDPQGNSLEATTVPGRVTVGSAEAEPTQPTGGEASAAREDSDGGSNTGLYIGLGVGAALAIAVIGGGLALWVRRRRTA